MQCLSYYFLKSRRIRQKTRRKLAEFSHPLNPWDSKEEGAFLSNLALGTIWGVVVAPPRF